MSISTSTTTDDAPKEADAAMDPPATIINIVEKPVRIASGEQAVKQLQQNSSLTEADVSKKRLCGVCHEREWKYKCSRCYLPSCSVTCSTLHRATHPALETKPVEPSPEPTSQSNGPAPRPGTVAAAGFKGPFAVLDESKELQMLFKMYPKLPSLLDTINAATLRPLEEPDDTVRNGFGRKKKEESWTFDKGLEKGREALKLARDEHESVREYSDLILQILSGEAGISAAELVQKELAEQNAKIIEALLKGEMR